MEKQKIFIAKKPPIMKREPEKIVVMKNSQTNRVDQRIRQKENILPKQVLKKFEQMEGRERFLKLHYNGGLETAGNLTKYLKDQNDFTVIGVLGKRSVGKSSLLNNIIGKTVFKESASKHAHLKQNAYSTKGIDIFITRERLILLDTESLFSTTSLQRINSSSFKIDVEGLKNVSNIENLAVKYALLMYSICHVIIVVQDNLQDQSLLKFIKKTKSYQSYCPNLFSVPEIESPKPKDDEQEEIKPPNYATPNFVFLYNKMPQKSLTQFNIFKTQQYLNSFFDTPEFHYCGKGQIHPNAWCCSKDDEENEDEKKENGNINFFLLPINEDPRKHEYSVLLRTFIDLILGLPNEKSTQRQLTEQEWIFATREFWKIPTSKPRVEKK